MPLVANSKLPSFERLRTEGQEVLPYERALSQDIRALHIGLLNMMPDAALEATERQFLRLVGNSNLIVQFHLHLFTLDTIKRGEKAQAHIAQYYTPFDRLKEEGLDALIITGANITKPDLTNENFWQPLCEVLDWADKNVTSTMCSCLATHAAVRHFYGLKRTPREGKLWGLYDHNKADQQHPLMQSVNTRFIVPHSRYNDISREQFQSAGCHVVVESEQAGVHMALSEDLFRFVFLQGHPEYDTNSLLKEYKREIGHFIRGERPDYPPLPENAFSPQNAAILEEYRERVEAAVENGGDIPAFPEQLLLERLYNVWRDSSKSFMNNWIGRIYQITHVDRTKPYMDGIDPADPLGIKAKSA